MELELKRIDYLIVGMTKNNCVKILPLIQQEAQQKIAIGDCDGVFQIISIKKQDIQIHFKSLPSLKISSIQLGGFPGEKIYVTSGNEVKVYTKKGKIFQNFDSGMSEPIQSMYVLGNNIFLCGKHLYNHYKDNKEIGSYLCGDRIIDVSAFYTNKNHRLMSFLACEGRMIRALEHSRVTMTMEVESAPSILYIYENNNKNYIIFGTIDGRIGLLDVENLKGFERWLINNEYNSSSISCLNSLNFSGESNNKNMIVGRTNGNIEVYQINLDDALDSPILIFQLNCNESITSLQCGIIGFPGYEEILVSTYTGRIFGLTTKTNEKNIVRENSAGNYVFSQDFGQKISKLKNEIEDLQDKVIKEREKYQTITLFDELSAIPLLEVKDSFILSNANGTYTLSIEVPTAIDNVLLQSDTSVSLIDVEKNSAVVSYSEANKDDKNRLLATYRCQINTNRLEVKIKTIEGEYGTLRAYITPTTIHPKCSRLMQYEIKPLSMHYRIHRFDDSRPMNKIIITGAFSLAEMHSWIYHCLPEVPEKPHPADTTILTFQSAMLKTILHCSYQKGSGQFMSDNISTISIIKEFITKEATKKNISIDLNASINDNSIVYVINLLDPLLIKQKYLIKKLKILKALEDMNIKDEEEDLLTNKYKDIVSNKIDFKQTTMENLEHFIEIIINLYLDYYKFKSKNMKQKVVILRETLKNYSREDILHLFHNNGKNED